MVRQVEALALGVKFKRVFKNLSNQDKQCLKAAFLKIKTRTHLKHAETSQARYEPIVAFLMHTFSLVRALCDQGKEMLKLVQKDIGKESQK